MRSIRSSMLLFVLATLAACADAKDEPDRINLFSVSTAVAFEAPEDHAFRMTVADAFRIATGGVIVTGEIAAGRVNKGDTVCLPSARLVEVMAIEVFKRAVESATAGDRVGLLLSNMTLEDISVGDVLDTACVTRS